MNGDVTTAIHHNGHHYNTDNMTNNNNSSLDDDNSLEVMSNLKNNNNDYSSSLLKQQQPSINSAEQLSQILNARGMLSLNHTNLGGGNINAVGDVTSLKSTSSTPLVGEEGCVSAMNNTLHKSANFHSIMSNKSASYKQENSPQATPIIAINDLRGSVLMDHMTDGERDLRCKLAALYRLIDMHGWAKHLSSVITARLASSAPSFDHFLAIPNGLMYHEVSAASLIKVDDHGDCIDRLPNPFVSIDRVAFRQHSKIYEVCPDVSVVAHIRVPEVVSVSCLKRGLLCLSAESQRLLTWNTDGISVIEYISNLNNFGVGKNSLIFFVRNSGALVCGGSIEEAWHLIRLLIVACQTQMRFLHINGDSNKGDVIKNSFKHTTTKNGDSSSKSLTNGTIECCTVVEESNNDDTNKGTDNSVFTKKDEEEEECNVVKDSSETFAKKEVEGEKRMSVFDVMSRDKFSENSSLVEFEALMRVLDSKGYRTGYTYSNAQLMVRMVSTLSSFIDQVEGVFEEGSAFQPNVWLPGNFTYDEENAKKNSHFIQDLIWENVKRGIQRKVFLTEKIMPPVERFVFETIYEDEIKQTESHPSETVVAITKKKKSGVTTTDGKITPTNTNNTLPMPQTKGSPPQKYLTITHKMSEKLEIGSVNTSDVESGTLRSATASPESHSHHRHKKGLKIAGIRFPSFSKAKH